MILTKEIAGFSGECSNFKRFSLINYELDIYIYNFENWLFSMVGSLQKWLVQLPFLLQENYAIIFRINYYLT